MRLYELVNFIIKQNGEIMSKDNKIEVRYDLIYLIKK